MASLFHSHWHQCAYTRMILATFLEAHSEISFTKTPLSPERLPLSGLSPLKVSRTRKHIPNNGILGFLEDLPDTAQKIALSYRCQVVFCLLMSSLFHGCAFMQSPLSLSDPITYIRQEGTLAPGKIQSI